MRAFWLHIKTCIGKYICFRGNASRSEFWHWMLFVAIISGGLFGIAATLIVIRNSVGLDTADNPLNWFGSIIFPIFVLLGLFILFCLLPTLAITVRRLRDAGYRPWIIIFPLLLLMGSFHPALVIALSGMSNNTPPEIPLSCCYAYLAFTAVVCLLYAYFLNQEKNRLNR